MGKHGRADGHFNIIQLERSNQVLFSPPPLPACRFPGREIIIPGVSSETEIHPLRHLPLPNTSKVESVIVWLEEHIEREGIQIGDRLPHETVIAEGSGLSRTCVREALVRLRTLGIIETRRHSGSRLIRPLSAHNLMRVLAARELPEVAFGHVGGMRSALEIGFAAEIFERASPEDCAELRGIVERMRESSTNREGFLRCEIAFHGKLIEITGNAMALWLWQMMEPFFRKVSPMRVPIPAAIIEKHARMARALGDRDRAAFEREIHLHHDHKLAWDSGRYAPEFLDPLYEPEERGD